MKIAGMWLICAAVVFGQASPGSLFTAGGALADPTRDLRAGQVGDIVTILVSDNTSALAKGVTNTSRKSSAKNSITSLAAPLAAHTALPNLLNLSNDQQLQGQGQTSRDLTLTTTVSARVASVTPNGLLVLAGTKTIGVNSEKQTILLSGLIRPTDLTPSNTILSNQIADLSIQVNGKGVVGDAIKRPFFLYRILMGLLPF